MKLRDRLTRLASRCFKRRRSVWDMVTAIHDGNGVFQISGTIIRDDEGQQNRIVVIERSIDMVGWQQIFSGNLPVTGQFSIQDLPYSEQVFYRIRVP